MMTFDTLVLQPLRDMLVEVVRFVPTLVSALFILILGLIFSKLVSQVIGRLLREVKLDKMLDKIGMSQVLHKGGVKQTFTGMVTSIIYWVLIVIFILITVKAMGMTIVSDSVGRLIAYIPHVISAVTVLVLGLILAKISGSFVHFVASYMELPQPKLLERITRWTVIIYALTVTLEELGFGSLLMGTTFHIVLSGVVFGFALAYGLGGRDKAASHLEKYGK